MSPLPLRFPHRPTLSRLATALGVAVLAGCSSAAPEPPLLQLQELTSAPRCSADMHCRSLPVGARACGGPSRYLVWSTLVNREDELKALAAQVTEQEKARNAASGRMSTCEVLADPGARCDFAIGQCIAGGGSPVRQGSPSQ
ncbi:hypothetical protein [Ideonella sp. B508-1]|uniref:hypothetical protein n=1 Tax=Ideonella sp. B508-1 TaxID=137716 RepID=UPI000349A935|nr:hypothetical protein [Ideonella sp. B508-1]